MDRRCPGLLLVLAIVALAILSGCVGKSTPNTETGGVQSVTLSPNTTLALEFGRTQNFSATAHNAAGGTVFTTVHFVSDNNAALTISNFGTACAGQWDSLSNPVVCTPGVTGIANVTAEAEGVSSAPAIIYVHPHIQSMQVAPVAGQTCLQANANCSCFSQGTPWQFQAKALGVNNADITNSVGPINWSFTNGNVLTVDANNTLPNFQVQVTARNPGITQLFASASGTISSPLNYTSCLVKSVMLQVQGGSSNTTSLNAGGTKTIEATVLDTLDFALTNPPITFSTSNPEIATVNSSGVVTGRQTAGTVDVSASCTPPTCNIGVLPGLPIYSTGGTLPNGQNGFGVIVANVAQPKPPTATLWATTTDCGDNFNCVSIMFPVTTGSEPVGTALGVPFTPNSMMFIPAGTRVYMGSDKGLMFVDVTASSPQAGTISQATTPCNVAVCGKLIAISADGNKIVVADTVTQPNQVYIWDAANPTIPPVDLLIPGATAAAFSPDQMKLFILTESGQMYVFSTVDAMLSVATGGPASSVAFAADGSFAYVANAPANAISGFATCNLADIGVSPALSENPLRVFPLPNVQEDHIMIAGKNTPEHSVITQDLLAIVPPDIQLLTAQFTRDVLDDPGQFTCNGSNPLKGQTAPVFWSDPPNGFHGFSLGPSFNLGQGDFTPVYMQVTGDGTQVILVLKNVPAVFLVNVNAGTTTAFPLANNASPLAASATLDGTQVFVASCDGEHTNPNTCGSIHIVNTQSGGDLQQAVYTNVNTGDSLCNDLPGTVCLPDLVAVRPQ